MLRAVWEPFAGHFKLWRLAAGAYAGRMSSGQRAFEDDVAIIGGGSGGFAAARTAAGQGGRVVVLEGGDPVGWSMHFARVYAHKSAALCGRSDAPGQPRGTMGNSRRRVSFNFAQVMARKNALVKGFADYREEQLGSGKFKFKRAMASFVDAHTLKLSTGETLTAASFIIASGSTVAPSPFAQLNDVGYLTSDSALELTRLPKSLIVLGGGAVAVEFAQFFARFGVRVT